MKIYTISIFYILTSKSNLQTKQKLLNFKIPRASAQNEQIKLLDSSPKSAKNTTNITKNMAIQLKLLSLASYEKQRFIKNLEIIESYKEKLLNCNENQEFDIIKNVFYLICIKKVYNKICRNL